MGSKAVEKLESTYNKSVKMMFDLPWATHRYLVEPLTGKPHVSRLLVKRYLSFISKIDLPLKTPLKTLMEIAKQDVRSVTGANLRRIMLQQEEVPLMTSRILTSSTTWFQSLKLGELTL